MSKRAYICLAVSLALFVVQSVFLWDFGIDDVGISYRYAEHLADGNGLNWNVGGPRVEGYSNFLWVLILAAGKWLGCDITEASKILGMVLGIANLCLLYAICRRLWSPARFWWLPVPLVALTPEWTAWAMSGLELALIGLFLLVSLVALTGDRVHRGWLLSVGAAGLILTRPEGPILAVILLLAGWLADRDQTLTQRLRTYSPPALALLATGLGLLIFRLIYFGAPMPNTVYAKFSLSLPSKGRVLEWFVFAIPFFALWTTALVGTRDSQHRWLLRACLALVIAQMIIVLPVNPVMYLLHRYQIPLLPMLVLPVPFFLAWVERRRSGLAAILGVLLLVWTMQGWPRIYTRLHVEKSFIRLQRKVAGVLRTLPDRPVVAIVDAGRIPYWTDLPTFDVWGLCDTEIARKGFTSTLALSRNADVYIFAVRSIANGVYSPIFGLDRIVWKNPAFRATYRYWGICERDEEAMSNGWFYDYALYIRNDWAEEQEFDLDAGLPRDQP